MSTSIELTDLMPKQSGAVINIVVTKETYADTGEEYYAFDVTTPVGYRLIFVDTLFIQTATQRIDISSIDSLADEEGGCYIKLPATATLHIEGGTLPSELYIGDHTSVSLTNTVMDGRVVVSAEGTSASINVLDSTIGNQTRLWANHGNSIEISAATIGERCFVLNSVYQNNVVNDGATVTDILREQMEKTLADPNFFRALRAV